MSTIANRYEFNRSDVMEALDWLKETTPREPLFTQLVIYGAGANAEEETFTMKLDGDDLAALCHAVHVLWSYHGFDPTKPYWEQEEN